MTLAASDAGPGWPPSSGRSTAALDAYTAPVVTGNGQHELLYRATDAAGNVETLKSAIIKIDGVRPTVIVSGLADGQLYGDSQDVRVTFQAVDPLSGMQSVIGRWTARLRQRHPAGHVRARPRPARAAVTATDNAGNATPANGALLRHHLVPGHAVPAGPVQGDELAVGQRVQAAGNQLDAARQAEAERQRHQGHQPAQQFRTLAPTRPWCPTPRSAQRWSATPTR